MVKRSAGFEGKDATLKARIHVSTPTLSINTSPSKRLTVGCISSGTFCLHSSMKLSNFLLPPFRISLAKWIHTRFSSNFQAQPGMPSFTLVPYVHKQCLASTPGNPSDTSVLTTSSSFKALSDQSFNTEFFKSIPRIMSM
ncbi:hypothetical protein V8G54_027396 [Vigna mungo]|uniref:Uncharacterized protein n=1 Tax=Vigna mungo TaxID=3915 RepID=A0AAQ3N2G2_VIGMU